MISIQRRLLRWRRLYWVVEDSLDGGSRVETLLDYGYSRDDISLLMSDATRGREFTLQIQELRLAVFLPDTSILLARLGRRTGSHTNGT
jgi:hypothetical protein